MIQFANTEYFYTLILVLVFVLFYWFYNNWKKRAKKRFGDAQVIGQLMPKVSEGKPLVKFILILIAFIFLVIGLVDPQVGSKLEKVKREGIDLMLVFDVSNSMLAEDIRPNRLERSKMAISNLIDKLEGEDAFHYLMSWKAGEFSVLRNKTSKKETIVKGWQSLLLESMRRVDETSDLVREEKERKKRHRLREIKFLLEKVRKSDGVRHILLHTSSGFQIFYEGDFKETDDVTEMGNEISSLVEQLTNAAKFFKSQSLEFLEIHLNKMKLILHKIPGQDGFLSIVGDKKLNPGFLRMELKKILKDVANLV